MNLSYKLFLGIIFLMFFGIETNAQISLSEFGAGTSYWLRLYNTPDETSVLANGSLDQAESSGTIVPNLFAVVTLNKSFALRAKAGLSQKNYESRLLLGDLVRIENLKQTIIPVGLNLEYRLPLEAKKDSENEEDENTSSDDKGVELVAGVGISRFFIQHDISRTVTGGEGTLPSSRFTGNDFGMNVMLGISYPLTERLNLLIFSQLNGGTFDHRVYQDNSDGLYDLREISLRGIEFGISLGFLLP